MTNYKWKRCQECGAKTASFPEGTVGCPECQIGIINNWEVWDGVQAATRARKRFELVCAAISGECMSAGYGDIEHMLKSIETLLTKMYGKVPEGGG